jgi:excisionase family DNA binding protein
MTAEVFIMEITAEDILLARRGQHFLLEKSDTKTGVLADKIELPPAVIRVLSETLSYLAQGKEVTVIPQTVDITTQQAAAVLRVSRPFVVKLLEAGEIPFRKVGKHRRILLEDVVAYKERIDLNRLKTLEKLTAQAQELNLGY